VDTQLGRTGTFDLLCSRMKLSNRICDHLDVRRGCAAATAYECRASLNDAPSMEHPNAIRVKEGTVSFARDLIFKMDPYSVLVVEMGD